MELEKLNVPKQKLNQLLKVGINNIYDLIKYLPKKYFDFSTPVEIAQCVYKDDQYVSVIGKIQSIEEKETKNKKKMVKITVIDNSRKPLYIFFFNQPYIAKYMKENETYMFCGKVSYSVDFRSLSMTPLYYSKNLNLYKRILPVYKKIKGMDNVYLADLIENALKLIPTDDYLESNVRKDFLLMDEYEAFKTLHTPSTVKSIDVARERFVFDDLFAFNFKLKKDSLSFDDSSGFDFKTIKSLEAFRKSLPYELTPDQFNVIREILNGMKNKKRQTALIQGDVGTGKTIVAFFLMLAAADCGYQSCIMAPRESLARQHYDELREKMEGYPYEVAFLSGNTKNSERKKILKRIESGEINFVVGTHSVFSRDVIYNNLALTIADEQHLFGVGQRNDLNGKSNLTPHSISMSATPIPRTMAMALYGDHISVHTIKDKPKGRKDILTSVVKDDISSYDFIKKEVLKGRQAYVVCPLIEDSESEKMKNVDSVDATFEKIKKHFKGTVTTAMITGDTKPDEFKDTLSKFYSGQIQVLVSTTIIEVGINVPNATVILIKNSERFGLAQLHQLRGRVGRGEHQSYCILQSSFDDKKSKIMTQTSDGFEIAKFDLQFRGPGDFLGTKQSGDNKYISLMLAYEGLYKKIDILTTDIYSDLLRYERYKFINDSEIN